MTNPTPDAPGLPACTCAENEGCTGPCDRADYSAVPLEERLRIESAILDDTAGRNRRLKSLLTLAADAVAAARPLPSDWVVVPHQECYSENFDTWFDSPGDSALVDGLKVGDTYKLQVSHYSIEREYVVTKVPDETNDDYEVEPVKAAPSAPAEVGIARDRCTDPDNCRRCSEDARTPHAGIPRQTAPEPSVPEEGSRTRRDFTDQEVRDWMERHDLENMGLTDARDAVEDAQSMDMLTAPEPLAQGECVGVWSGNAAARGEPGGPVEWATGLTYSSLPDGTKLYASPQPAAEGCTCPSGDGSLRWPCPKHPRAEIKAEAFPVEPLKVFHLGPWTWTETGHQFTGMDLDGAAFAAYRDYFNGLSATPNPPQPSASVDNE